MSGNLVRDHPGFHIVAVGQPEMFLRRHVTEHRGAVPADHGRADGRRDVVVARGDVGGERAERVEGRLVTGLQLEVDVLLDLVHRHVAGPLDHHLHVVAPRDLGELAQRAQLGELGGVVGVGDRARPQAAAQRESDVVGGHDLAQLFEMRVEEALLVVGEAPRRHDRATPADDAGDARGGERDEAQAHAGVDREVVDALLGLLDDRVAVDVPAEVLRPAVDLLERLVDGHRADRHGRVPQDPLAGRVDVAAGRQVHHGVGAPPGGPPQFLDLVVDRRRD